MYTVLRSATTTTTPDHVVISPQKHEYQFLKQDNGCRAITDASNNVLAVLPSPRVSWSQFKEEHLKTMTEEAEAEAEGRRSRHCRPSHLRHVFAMEHREHVMELQLFYDPRIPGWELVTELGGIGGSEVFCEGDYCGKTVRQIFCSAFCPLDMSNNALRDLPLLLNLLPAEFTFHLQMSLQRPLQLHLTDILSLSVLPSSGKTFVTSTYLHIQRDISALKHMPFEVPTIYEDEGDFPTHCPVLVRSKSTGQSTVFQHPTFFAHCLVREIPAKLLFRFLCLQSAGKDHVQEYVRLFPKHRKAMRLCRHAVSNWIGQVQQSYYTVYIAKTKTLHQITPSSHIPLVRDLHTLYRSSLGKTHITFAVVEDWVYQHCHPEDVMWYCSPL